MTDSSQPVIRSTDEKICRWVPIEPESSTYQPGCCNEWWDLHDDCELYPYCHWCGGKIEEVEAEADEPGDPDGECFRGVEYEASVAQAQANILRDLKR